MLRFTVLTSIALSFFASTALEADPCAEDGYYQGKLAHRSIVMAINAGSDRATQYRYTRFGPPIRLEIDHGFGSVCLTEKHSGGAFAGHLDAKDDFTGVWTSADQKRSLNFALHRIATVASYEVREPKYSVTYSIPQFTAKTPFDGALNQLLTKRLKTEMGSTVSEFQDDAKDPDSMGPDSYESKTTTEVLYADDSMVSLLFLTAEFTGGAHWNYSYAASTFVWRDGRLVELHPSDIISPRSVSTLTNVLITELKRQDAASPDSVAKIGLAHEVVNPTLDGLLFTFAPYAVDGFAGGTHTVMLPWSKLENVVRDGSPVEKLMPLQITATVAQ